MVKYSSFALLAISATGANAQGSAGTKGFTCPDNETLVFSCFQSIESRLTNIGDTWWQNIQCGGNGCECVDSCSTNCMEPIIATLVDKSEEYIIQLSGYSTGQISFKAGNQASPADKNSDGNYVWGGNKEISHIDICVGEPQPQPQFEPIPAATACSCGESSNPCMKMGCDDSGACVEIPLERGTSCGLAGGTTCYPEADVCDGAGTCVSGNAPDGTSCGNPETPCMFADSCSAGKCVTGQTKTDGTPCGDEGDECNEADSCQAGQCVTNIFKDEGTVCGDQAITDCHPLGDKCDGAGSCKSILVAAGSSCGNAETACMNGDSCSADGTCVPGGPKADGLSCGDAADECNVADACSNGVCITDIFKSSGTACGSTYSSVCNKPDSCDGSGTCLPNLVAEGTVCGQEETDCMYADKCDANGSCIIGGPKPTGTSCGDPFSSVCNGPDTCDGRGTCQPNLVADDTACGKAEDQCNLADKCMSGECVSTTKPDGTSCGGALSGVCDVADTCSAGQCIDNVADTSVVCREATGECDVAETCDGTHKSCPADAFKPVGSSCGDSTSSECTQPDTCDSSGTCLDNHAPDGSSCGYEGDQCMFADSCAVGSCSVGGPKPSTTKCGTISGACDVQDFCDGAGSCPDIVADSNVVCRAADGDCDVPEMCDGASKACPTDAFKSEGEFCGKTGSDLDYCENQDTCDGMGGCVDAGIDPIEYTFKCGTANFFCGNEVDGTLCNDGAKETLKISPSDCDALIAAVNTDGVDPFNTKCPNGNAISHYVIYDCRGTSGTKYELDKDGNEIAVTCSRRKLRGGGLFSFF